MNRRHPFSVAIVDFILASITDSSKSSKATGLVRSIFLAYEHALRTLEKCTIYNDLNKGRSLIFNFIESNIAKVPSEAAKIFWKFNTGVKTASNRYPHEFLLT